MSCCESRVHAPLIALLLFLTTVQGADRALNFIVMLVDDMGATDPAAPAAPFIRRRTSTLLDAWLKETGAQMPVPNPAYDQRK